MDVVDIVCLIVLYLFVVNCDSGIVALNIVNVAGIPTV